MTYQPRRLPAEFIAQRVHLLPAELAYGYRSGYIDEQAVVQLATIEVDRGRCDVPAVEELGLLLSDELDRVPDLITQIDTAGPTASSDPSRVWLFLHLALAYEQKTSSVDPLSEIEAIYADFDYPEEIEGFVPYLPAPEGQASSRDALEDRWRSYLERSALRYAERGGPHT